MAAKRYLSIPENIQLLDPETDAPLDETRADGSKHGVVPPVTFLAFLRRSILSDPRFNRDFKGLAARSDIADAIRKGGLGAVAELDEDDWKLLDATCDAPQRARAPHLGGGYEAGFGFYNPELMVQFRPFLDAIKNATTKPPTK